MFIIQQESFLIRMSGLVRRLRLSIHARACVYFEGEPGRRSAASLLNRDEVHRGEHREAQPHRRGLSGLGRGPVKCPYDSGNGKAENRKGRF